MDNVSPALRTRVTGLATGILYRLRVAAGNVVGIGAGSPIIDARAAAPTQPIVLLATTGDR